MNRVVVVLACLLIHFTSVAQFRKKNYSTSGVSQTQPVSSQLSPDVTEYKSNDLDMFVHDLYVKSYLGQESKILNFDSVIFAATKDPYPYIYATWFHDGVVDETPRKKPHNLRLIEKIIADPGANGTVKASAYYQKCMYYLFANKFAAATPLQPNIGNLRNWQFVGPFENISKSGFYKNFGPLEHPEPKAQFTSKTNAKISWFTPARENPEGWTPVVHHIRTTTGVVYAQTFVNSAKDQEIYCNAGGGGAIRVWLNDELIISEPTERITEMDAYTVKAKLQKGINRVLVQLSYSDNGNGNFSVRLTDTNFQAIPGLTGSTVFKPYTKAVKTGFVPVKHFAEEFFKNKIAAEPGNVINYLLLADVFLRNKKLPEAQEFVLKALEGHPDNNLLRMKLIDILLRDYNRSRMHEELARLRQLDPNCLLGMEVDILTDIQNQRLPDALQKLDLRIASYGESYGTAQQMLNILFQQKKFQEFTSLAEKSYEKYPGDPTFTQTMFAIKREVNRDIAGALNVYDKYFLNHFDYSLLMDYSKNLIGQGQIEKGQGLVEKVMQEMPYDVITLEAYADYHSNSKNFDKAEFYIKKALALAPYDARLWATLGNIRNEKHLSTEAIEAFNKSLQYDPNQYEVINKLRVLKDGSESYKLFPNTTTEQIISSDNNPPVESDAGYYVIHDEVNTIIHPGGATEKYYLFAVRITNESGINEFKESKIGYGRWETLLIEEANVVKKSGAEIRGDRNENQVVFTNLEVGDAVIVRYRIQTYSAGRFMKDHWAKHYFGNTAGTSKKLVNVFIPAGVPLRYTWNTTEPVKAVISNVEDFKKYSWEMRDLAPVKEEPFMPNLVDVVPVLHLSTLDSWQQIADWYADVIHSSSEESHELKSAFQLILPEAERNKLSQFEKARKIYNFILTNIRYSSVSFRQSAFVPQRTSETLTSRLGDCKDLATLFTVMCKMAGINCHVVLVSTHNNGTKDMALPSVDFNHCIAKATLDGKAYFIELTDRYLPFASLPNNLVNSSVLEIAPKTEALASTLKILAPDSKVSDVTSTKIEITPDNNNDLAVAIKTTKSGRCSSDLRSLFSDISNDKQLKILEQRTSSRYKNGVMVKDVSFENLNSLSDTVVCAYHFVVRDEVAEIGSIRTFKVVYPDVVAQASNFAASQRTYAIDYNAYEDTDLYTTDVTINIPEGKKLIEVPADENLSFKGMSYALSYMRVSPTQLQVLRSFKSNRNSIPKEDYTAFQTFLEKIVKAESKMIAYQ